MTVLHLVSSEGRTEVMRILLEAGAATEAKDRVSLTNDSRNEGKKLPPNACTSISWPELLLPLGAFAAVHSLWSLSSACDPRRMAYHL